MAVRTRQAEPWDGLLEAGRSDERLVREALEGERAPVSCICAKTVALSSGMNGSVSHSSSNPSTMQLPASKMYDRAPMMRAASAADERRRPVTTTTSTPAR